eukprot:3984210-Amphidinium_carterae.1
MKHLMRYLRGSTETVLVHTTTHWADKSSDRGIIKAQADSDREGCHTTRKSTSCRMIWWSGVLIPSYARTQSTIATSSALSEYYGACAVASEAIYVNMIHAKTMLVLMEPESLAPYGYGVQDSQGVRDRLDTSANSTTLINHIDRKVG